MEVGYDGTLLAGEGEIEQSAYAIHAPMHRLLEGAAAVFHTHMPFASALTRLENPRVLPIGQTEMGVIVKAAYDMDYGGPACEEEEGVRLAGAIGDKTVLFMANHGVVTVGNTVAEAYDRLYYVERVAQVQLYAMWTQQPLKYLSKEVQETTMREFAKPRKYGAISNAQRHFDALKRILDRKEPDYKE
jgi:ribulose-5-phosphate 4-epimerase/fuculose-1-phosphate aldolase